MVLLSVQGMDVARIAKVTFTSPDRVREVVNNFNEDGFESLYPKYAGGRPPTFTLPQRQQIKKIALSRPADHGLPFSTWKQSNDPDFEVKKNRVLELYDIAEGKAKPRTGGRVRSAQLVAPARPAVGANCVPTIEGLHLLAPPPSTAGNLQTDQGRTPHVRGARHEPRQAVRTCQGE
jgi:hypothetical protein